MNLQISPGLKIKQLDTGKLLQLMANNKTDFESLKSKIDEVYNKELKDQFGLPTTNNSLVYIKINPQHYQEFNFETEDQKIVKYTSLLTDMKNKNVDIWLLTQKIMMSAGFQRLQWRYFNKDILTPELKKINKVRVDAGLKPLIRRRKI